MNPQQILATFTLRLVEHITDEMGETEFVSEEILDRAITLRLESVADFVWEQYKGL